MPRGLASHARTREKAAQFGAVLGRKRAVLRTKIDKNRQKSMKNDEDFEVDLLIAKELMPKSPENGAAFFYFVHFLSPVRNLAPCEA